MFKPFPFSGCLPAVLALCAAGLLIHPAAGAEAGPAVTVSVLVEEVLKSHPEIGFYEAEVAAAKAGRRAAARPANPELVGTFGQNRVRNAGGTLAGEGVAWSAGLMQQFEWPGRIGLRKAIAGRDLILAELGLARFRTALAGRVRSLAYGLGAAQEQAGASREDSYSLVQRNAMKTWERGADFLAELKADKDVAKYLKPAELEAMFDLGYHLKHADTIFKRVFGEA